MKRLRKNWLLIALLLFSLLCYLSILISPAIFWPAVFLALAIPFVVVLNFLHVIFYIFKRSKLIVFPLVGLLAGSPFVYRTVSFSNLKPSIDNLSVLSFNAKLFRKAKTYSAFSGEMINWVVNDSSLVKCIQEYSTNNRWAELDITGQLEKQGYHSFIFNSKLKNNDHSNGMAIFSKNEIVRGEVILEDSSTVNAILFADIKWQNQIIRIYNVHFESMSLNLYHFKSPDNAYRKWRGLISKLRHGSVNRQGEINTLIEHTRTSPYPFIICGDFNETPYGYNYQKLNSLFENSFEQVGNGFGFTLNSILFFLRIDHQFYGKGIVAKQFKVDRSMTISDHFPTYGYYTLN